MTWTSMSTGRQLCERVSGVMWVTFPSPQHVLEIYTSQNPRFYDRKSEGMLSPLTRSSRGGHKMGRVIVREDGRHTADYAVRPLRRPQSRSQNW